MKDFSAFLNMRRWATLGAHLGQEDPLEKEIASTPGFLPGKSHGQRSLVGCSPWGCIKGRTWLSDQTATTNMRRYKNWAHKISS